MSIFKVLVLLKNNNYYIPMLTTNKIKQSIKIRIRIKKKFTWFNPSSEASLVISMIQNAFSIKNLKN